MPLLVPCYADVGRCVVTPGEHELPPESVLPGLRLTIPAGWTGAENDAGELHLKPPMRPDDALLVWHGIAAVQSTGPERGKVLPTVGRSADALLHWVQTNPDFRVVGVPRSTTVGDIAGTLLTVEVSKTARFGDPECPANPHCAAFFTDPDHWNGNFFAIGAPETAQLLFATIRQSGRDSTLVVALDAPSPAGLATLRQAAQPLLASLRLPPGVSSA